MAKNVIGRIEEAAAKHQNNPIIKALLDKLSLQRSVVRMSAPGDQMVNPLAAYARGTDGEEGYSLLLNPGKGMFDELMSDAYRLHEVAIIADCLVTALAALGEAM